jgi:hypothetical protein
MKFPEMLKIDYNYKFYSGYLLPYRGNTVFTVELNLSHVFLIFRHGKGCKTGEDTRNEISLEAFSSKRGFGGPIIYSRTDSLEFQRLNIAQNHSILISRGRHLLPAPVSVYLP